MSEPVTVGQLKDALSDYSDDMPVVFAYNYGDYTGTLAASFPNEIRDGLLVESGPTGMKIIDDDTDPSRYDGVTEVVVMES